MRFYYIINTYYASNKLIFQEITEKDLEITKQAKADGRQSGIPWDKAARQQKCQM